MIYILISTSHFIKHTYLHIYVTIVDSQFYNLWAKKCIDSLIVLDCMRQVHLFIPMWIKCCLYFSLIAMCLIFLHSRVQLFMALTSIRFSIIWSLVIYYNTLSRYDSCCLTFITTKLQGFFHNIFNMHFSVHKTLNDLQGAIGDSNCLYSSYNLSVLLFLWSSHYGLAMWEGEGARKCHLN